MIGLRERKKKMLIGKDIYHLHFITIQGNIQISRKEKKNLLNKNI